MDTPRIAEQFDSVRGHLEKLLGSAADPGQAMAALGRELDKLADECAARTVPEEANVVRGLVEAVRCAVQGTLQATAQAQRPAPVPPKARWYLSRWRRGGLANRAEQRESTVCVRTERLLTAVEDALGEVDRALARIEPPAPRTLPWEYDAELLDLLLDLLSAQLRQDGRFALARVCALREDLRSRHGIRVVEYGEACGLSSDGLFDLPTGPVPSPEEVRTVAPALISAEQGVLRQGRVVPRPSEYGGSDEQAN